MADIISIRSHPAWGYEPLPRTAGGNAAIIMFPGVRYERPAEMPAKSAKPSRSAKAKSGDRGKRKSQA